MFHISFVRRKKRKGDKEEGQGAKDKGDIDKDNWRAREDKKDIVI